ncbi:MAG: glycosyltransferase family 39 protein [Bacteroidota bacterium]|nr:glycosyltransferase family 39 protein [Bacteroidota bacterium]
MKKTSLILWGLILIKFILQYFLIDPVYELHRDEFLHLDQARHLAWGFASVPPVTSWISYLIMLLGNGVFWVKFFPALFGAITILVVWKTIEELRGNWFALTLGAVSVLFSALLRINTLYQPNSLDILAWTLIYFILVKFISTEKPKWLYSAAVVFAIGFLNKYNIAFLILGLLPAILLTEHRRLFRNKHFYYAALLELILISPNMVWQYQNNFPVIHHLKELAATQLVNVNRIDFLKEQLLFFFSSTFVIVAAMIAFVIFPSFRKFRLVGWSFLITILLFAWFRAKSYYAIGLYPILLVFGAVYLEQLLNKKWGRYLRPIVLTIPILLFFPMFKVAFPNHTPKEIRQNAQMYQDFGLLKWEDGNDHALPQDFADMLGWKELVRKVDSAYTQISDPDHTLIYCDNYGQAGAINYYSKIKNIGAVSLNADYINWFRLDREIRHVIRVKEIDDNGKELIVSQPYFETVVRFDEITNEFARERGTTIYLLIKSKVNVNEILQREIDERKKHQ